MEILIQILLFLTSVFLILLVLVQRGRGGGLAGAFGGLGGQSAFGTKAGDLFTRITIGVATFWIILCAFAVWYFSAGSRNIISLPGGGAQTSPNTLPPSSTTSKEPVEGAPAGKAPASAPSGSATPDRTTGATPSSPATASPPAEIATPPADAAPEKAK